MKFFRSPFFLFLLLSFLSITPASAAEEENLSMYQNKNAEGKINMTYFGIFQGPSVKNPSGFQPTPNGGTDPDRPVVLRNYMGLGYNIREGIAITGTAFWTW